MIRPREWQALIRGLGESLVDLAGAEFEELGKDLTKNGRSLGVALGLAGAAVFIAFWALGLGIAAVVVILDIWFPVWQAALIALASICLVGLIIGALALRRFKALQAPTEMVRRRWEDHLDWWQTVRGALGERPQEIEPEPAGDGRPKRELERPSKDTE